MVTTRVEVWQFFGHFPSYCREPVRLSYLACCQNGNPKYPDHDENSFPIRLFPVLGRPCACGSSQSYQRSQCVPLGCRRIEIFESGVYVGRRSMAGSAITLSNYPTLPKTYGFLLHWGRLPAKSDRLNPQEHRSPRGV